MRNTHRSRSPAHQDYVWSHQKQTSNQFGPFFATRGPIYLDLALTQRWCFHDGELIAELYQVGSLPRNFLILLLPTRSCGFLDGARNTLGDTPPHCASQLLQEAAVLDPVTISKHDHGTCQLTTWTAASPPFLDNMARAISSFASKMLP